ncbi:MAG: glycosyltransferase [Verrucomicrobiota bacterium]
MSTPKISVILPTHNPRHDYLITALDALKAQSLPTDEWELLVIDNASDQMLPEHDLLSSDEPSRTRVITEKQLGLTKARQCGIRNARAELIVFVDDDNVLSPSYLETALALMTSHDELGVYGGKVIPRFESAPPDWIEEFIPLLACQDFGEEVHLSGPFDGSYPKYSPVGAGMVVRTTSAIHWADSSSIAITDRSGSELSSGGDNDIILHILKNGQSTGWFPSLTLDHLIPDTRVEPAYLARLNEGIQKSWMQLNTLHGINPWPPIHSWTLLLRILKAWISHQGWNYPIGYIRWKGACGHFKGRIKHS